MPNGQQFPRPAQTLSEQTLLEVVRGRSQATESRDALHELLQRRPERPSLLAEIVTDRQRPAELRTAAAVALGRHPSPTGERALIDVVADPDPAVVRRAAEALGRTAGPEALERLETVTPPDGPARRSVEFARTLLSYRHGLDRHRLRQPQERSLLTADPRQATEVQPTALRPATTAPILADAEKAVPALPFSDRGAVRFVCGDHEFVILITREIANLDGLLALTRRTAVVGAVLEHSPITGRYFLAEYLLTDPASRGERARLFGVRPDGTVVHVGTLEPTGSFELRATDTRYSPPVSISGEYHPTRARLQFDRMLIHSDLVATQRQPREPRRIGDSEE
jgi:hypothetical protein